ncbi:MAG TPA: helix-turn-helix transcriptional regulator [Steroidobacter sp.]|uniref:helix-turn-helix domain-containing protein n=1 Tax=Steroidobacter sp. TaxID=1978227 RepID=UPI002ED7DD03
MSSSAADFATALRAARETKRLSQRDLSNLVNVPQGHISRIESGTVDLRLSSLIELARALDLELALVPRKSLPAVQSILRAVDDGERTQGSSRHPKPKEVARLLSRLAALTRLFPESVELAQITRQMRDLMNLPLTAEDHETLNEVDKILSRVRGTDNLEPLQRALTRLQQLRSEIVHNRISAPSPGEVRPAYSLEDDESGR